MNQKLQNQITSKLETLDKVIEKIRNKVIEPDNSEMWDSGYYYDLASKLKEAVALLRRWKRPKTGWLEPTNNPGSRHFKFTGRLRNRKREK